MVLTLPIIFKRTRSPSLSIVYSLRLERCSAGVFCAPQAKTKTPVENPAKKMRVDAGQRTGAIEAYVTNQARVENVGKFQSCMVA